MTDFEREVFQMGQHATEFSGATQDEMARCCEVPSDGTSLTLVWS